MSCLVYLRNAYFTGFRSDQTFTNVNGYLIPNLTYKSGEQMEQLGKYGFLRRDYLKNHRNSLYQVMLLQDSISEHLLEVDKAAREREEIILKQLEKKEPLPDKEKDQIAWVRAANQHRAIAEEIILKELILSGLQSKNWNTMDMCSEILLETSMAAK